MNKLLSKLVLFLFVILLGGSSVSLSITPPKMGVLDKQYIPLDYYDSPCIVPWGMPVKDWLTKFHWGENYEAGFWDCSKMSLFTEWAVENCGHEAQIKVSADHAWVEIKFEDHWYIYEATSRRFVAWQPKEFYQEVATYDSVYQIAARQQYLYKESPLEFLIWFKSEWAWWLTDENN